MAEPCAGQRPLRRAGMAEPGRCADTVRPVCRGPGQCRVHPGHTARQPARPSAEGLCHIAPGQVPGGKRNLRTVHRTLPRRRTGTLPCRLQPLLPGALPRGKRDAHQSRGTEPGPKSRAPEHLPAALLHRGTHRAHAGGAGRTGTLQRVSGPLHQG